MIPCNHNYELGQFLNQQDEEFKMVEEREKQINDRVKELTSEGEVCDFYGVTIHKNVPYVYYNLFESLAEIPESEQKVISEMWRDAVGRIDMFMVQREAIFARIDKLVQEYWMRQAKHIAQSEL